MTEEEKAERERLRELRNEVLNQMANAIQTEMELVKSNDGPNAYVPSIAAQLRLHGVKGLRIEFAGGGDSGQVESVTVTDNDGEEATQYEYQNQGDPFFELFANWAYDFIEANSQTDWCNNDGGNGHIEFDLANGKFDWEVCWNETISQVGDSGEEDI